MVGSFFGMFKITNSIVVASGIVLETYIVIVKLYNQKQVERLGSSGIAEIDKMDGRRFEVYLGHLFQMHGYSTEVTKASGDFGGDLVLKKEGEKFLSKLNVVVRTWD